nr:hypothetical protein [Tanacetum cinerariifolium]
MASEVPHVAISVRDETQPADPQFTGIYDCSSIGCFKFCELLLAKLDEEYPLHRLEKCWGLLRTSCSLLPNSCPILPPIPPTQAPTGPDNNDVLLLGESTVLN